MIVYVKASEVHPRRGARRPPVVSARARFYLPALLRTFHLLIPPFCSRSTCLPATLSHAYANTGDTATATWNGASLDTHVPPPRTHGEWWRLFSCSWLHSGYARRGSNPRNGHALRS